MLTRFLPFRLTALSAVALIFAACGNAAAGETIQYNEGNQITVSEAEARAYYLCIMARRDTSCVEMHSLLQGGSEFASFYLSHIAYANIQTPARRRRQALGNLIELADQGYLPAQAVVGGHILFYPNAQSDLSLEPELGIQYLRNAHDDGNGIASEALARAYLEGVGVQRSLPNAIAFFEIASQRGYTLATYRLAIVYLDDDHDLYDKNRATHYMRLAAARGLIIAADGLCTNSYIQFGELSSPLIEQDEADVWCERARELQDALIE